MKVVLTQDVAKVGRKYDIKAVADGYALNFLIPNGLAETATELAVAKIDKIKANEAAAKKIRQDLLLKNFGDLKGVTITLEKPANKEGHLFAAVHKTEIVEAIKSQTRLDVEPDFIKTENIKAAGEHEIEVRVGDRAVMFKLKINPAEEEKAEAGKKAATKKTKK